MNMFIQNDFKEFIFDLLCLIRDFTRAAASLSLLFVLCGVVHAIPINITATTPNEQVLGRSNLLETGATDFCIGAFGGGSDFGDSVVSNLVRDYDITPGGFFTSSQTISRSSIGFQEEALGPGGLGLCFFFPSDPLGPSEQFSVTIETGFLGEVLPPDASDEMFLAASGLDMSSCVFSYEPEDSTETIYLPPSSPCVQMVAGETPTNPRPPNSKMVKIIDTPEKRVIMTVPEPSSIILFGTGAISVIVIGWRRKRTSNGRNPYKAAESVC